MESKEKDKIIIKAEHVCFTYQDGTKALNDVSLEIKEGRRIALLGANGSGKSTFFLCLNAIHKPQEGVLYYEGSPYDYSRKGLLNLRSRVGIVFQEPDNQLFSPNVQEEIAFGVLNMGVSKQEAQKRVYKVMEDLKILPFCDRPTHYLSGGQKKQVSIADILVMEPEVVLLDEPAASLDPMHADILNEMIDMLTERGITVIISTHDVDFAYSWSDEAVLFHEGSILAHGRPEEIFTNLDALKIAHSKQPAVLRMFNSLCQRGMLDETMSLPKTLEELADYMEEIFRD